MGKKSWMAMGIISGILILLMVVSYLYMDSMKITQRRVSISVVVYGSTSGKWTSFRQGVEQAATDMEATVEFLTMSGTNDSQEEEEQIEKELEEGAEGMVVAVADSQKMADVLTRTASVVPVVLAESKLDTEDTFICVEADAYAMGKELAAQIAEEEPDDISITVVQSGDERISQRERLAGFRAGCLEYGRKMVQVLTADSDALLELMESEEPVVVAALDDQSLEEMVQLLADEQEQVSLYGIGSSEQIVAALDQGKIQGIVFQNEFNMGYEAVEALVQKIREGWTKDPAEIDYHRATEATLHEPENERLLYPIIQ
jgi:ribose transport system substrate-binding protein